jgi:3-dehydroquinate synthase
VLPDVYADGMAEAIKYGVLCDATLFETMKRGLAADALEEAVERCVAIKAGVCAGDECDRGQRQMLNLGHTFGHAIERCSDYRLPHGHAVAVGMVYAARIATHLRLCDGECVPQVIAALEANGLPTDAPYPAAALAEAALGDKKRAGGTLTLVLPKAIGQCVLYPVPVGDLPALAQTALG